MPPKRSSGSSHRSSSPSRSSSSSSRSSASRSSGPSRPSSSTHASSRPSSARPDRPVSAPARPAAQPPRPPRQSAMNVAPILYADHARRQAQNAYNQGYMAGSMNNGQPMYNSGYAPVEQPQAPEQFICEYCGYTTTDPAQTVCPSCGAPLVSASAYPPASEQTNPYQEPSRGMASDRPASGRKPKPKKKSPVKFIILAVVLIFLALTLLKACGGRREHGDNTARNTASSNTLHVDVLGRDLTFDEDTQSYYDEKTDCYLSDTEDGYQYWYEGISSDFGDFGWMEYDADKDQWYIEQAHNDWVELPAEYDTSDLWHIE